MMRNINALLLAFVALMTVSCVSTGDVRYLQENENLTINEEGLVPYNVPEYRITKNDILKLNIITTPKGDAAQFYSSYNTSGGTTGRGNNTGGQNNNINRQGGSSRNGNGNVNFYFNGIKVNPQGEIEVYGIGLIQAEGRTIEAVAAEIQERVNENFLNGKSEVRLNTDGITYYILGDVETVGITGQKVAYTNTLTLPQAIAMNGGLNRTVDRTDVKIVRKLPEGMKVAHIDLTREDTMNSPYFWVQNGDEIYLNTRKKNLNGFGKDPIQSLTTGVSILTTVMSVYLIISRL